MRHPCTDPEKAPTKDLGEESTHRKTPHDRDNNELPPFSRYSEINEELSFHFSAFIEDAMEKGHDRTTAEAQAHRRFGSVQQYVQELDDLRERHQKAKRRKTQMNAWIAAPQSAWRTAWRRPSLALAVVVLMGLGLGATAITFGLLDRLLLRAPVGVEKPGELHLVRVERAFLDRRVTNTVLSFPDFQDFERAKSTAATAVQAGSQITLGRGHRSSRVRAAGTSGGFFDLLGTLPHLGRLLDTSDEGPGAAPVAVIGYDLWRHRFDADPDILGRTLDLKNGQFMVVGVAPRGFSGTGVRRVDLWLPLPHAAQLFVSDSWRDSRGAHWLGAVVRLDSNASVEAAAAELTTLHRLGRAESPGHDPLASVKLVPLDDPTRALAGKATIAGLLAGVSFLLLALVCTNVTNLLLAHAFHQRRDRSIRLALGIDRGRLVAEQLVFALLLTAMGGILALSISYWGGQAVRSLLLPDIAWSDAGTSPRILALVFIAVAVSGMAAALLPALEARRTSFAAALGRNHDQLGPTRVRRFFLTCQVALSVCMLVGAGLFIRSFERAADIDLGFDADGLLVISLETEANTSKQDRQRDLDRTLAWLDARPEINVASVAGLEAFRSSWSVRLRVPGIETLPRVKEGGPYVYPVGAHFFETMGLKIQQGRSFLSTDRKGTPLVTIVNQTMAEQFWPGETALGQCMIINNEDAPCSTVIGIVENAHRQAIVEGTQLLYYVPLDQEVLDTRGRAAFYARTTMDLGTLAPQLSRDLGKELETARNVRVQPFANLVAPHLEDWRLGATLFGVFGALALLVATAGLYSNLTFEVARRRGEIGIRTALGATSMAITHLVVLRAFVPVIAGLLGGLLLARLAAPLVREQLFEVAPTDGLTFSAVALAIIASAALAVALPARRATLVDPMENLRNE